MNRTWSRLLRGLVATTLALVVSTAALATPQPSMEDLCKPLPVGRFQYGLQRGIDLTVEVGPSNERLDSPLTVTVAVRPGIGFDRVRLRWAREDRVDTAYRFPATSDETHHTRDLPAEARQVVELGPQKRGSVYYFQATALAEGRENANSRVVICIPLLPGRREHARLPGIAQRLSRSRAFRQQLFALFGFTRQAAEYIAGTSSFDVHKPDTTQGGGGWCPWDRLVLLNGSQREAAVHECCHVFWHDYRRMYPNLARDLARDVVRLADMDPRRFPHCRAAIEFARGYVNGIGTWKGMYATDRGKVADVHHLTDDDFAHRVIDWEIFAGFCSWTMGRFKDGPHRLPRFMWRYFEPVFTGTIHARPYYDGGPP